jgi:hypothetical protein
MAKSEPARTDTRMHLSAILLFLVALLAALPVAPARAAGGKLLMAEFTAREADPEATQALGLERAFRDTRVAERGILAVFLHGAGTGERCGPSAHLKLLAGFGFHVFSPCYVSGYGVENCGDDIAGCRLEAFDGHDRHPFVTIPPADSIERRIVRGLRHLAVLQPDAGWERFVDGDRPRWEKILLTGHSHGASTAALIGTEREVLRIVTLAGPYDPGQAWLHRPPRTPRERYFGLTHRRDRQHPGHLAAFAALGYPGEPVLVDDGAPPRGGSHRLVTDVPSRNPHSAVRAGGSSPKRDGRFVLEPVWRHLYGVEPEAARSSTNQPRRSVSRGGTSSTRPRR